MISLRVGRFAGVEEIMREACGEQFTGAVARIEHGGRVVFERAYGETRSDSLSQPVYADTRFDLASLTKLFIATLVLESVAGSRLALDEPLTRILPRWGRSEQSAITARMLLAHNSGMNSGADYHAMLAENVEQFALSSGLLAPPGDRVIYSDLGFIALGTVLALVTGHSLGTLADRVFRSRTLGFRPRARTRPEIPATEDDGWRGRVQGFVHDEKAYLMGGIAGHAGLFGTAADVAMLTEWYLGAPHGREAAPVPAALLQPAVREQAYDPVLRRGLGWALKTSDENSCGRYMHDSSFGHTGFVGTCVWADPTRDVQGVLLTNAVYFGRNDTRDFRASFYEAMIEDLNLR